MGKDTKADRKSTTSSSSARAAEVLAAKGGFGFGGFSGAAPIGGGGLGFGAAAAARIAASAAAVTSGTPGDSCASTSAGVDYAGGAVPLTLQVHGELAQCIRHLSKKDPTTKTKTLQNLRALIPTCPTTDLVNALPAWIYMYRRLIMDSSRAVRSETASTLATLLTAVGKAIAPHLKTLMGPWHLAMYDTYGDAAAASRNAFETVFASPQKQLDVVLFCRTELMTYLKDQLAATPQQLGDPRKDSPEELQERHERVQSACLAALAGLVELLAPLPAPATTAAAAEDDAAAGGGGGANGKAAVLAGVREVLGKPGFWKGATGARSVSVRRAAYGLARVVAQRAAATLLADCAAEAAVAVLGALGEKDPGNHGAMWAAVLTYGKFCPDGWTHVNMRKMFLPRLYALLRHGCHGSATSSMPALLPLLQVLPLGTLGPSPDVLVAMLEAVWAGSQDPACNSRPAKAAYLAAYPECLAWGLVNSTRLVAPTDGAIAAAGAAAAALSDAAPPAAAYCHSLLQASLAPQALAEALRQQGPQGEAAAELVAKLVQAVAAAGERTAAAAAGAAAPAATDGPAGPLPPPPLACLVDAICEGVRNTLVGSLAAGYGTGDADGGRITLTAACDGVTVLLDRLQRVCTAPSAAAVAARVAAEAVGGLTSGGIGGLPPDALQLLASLLREYGGGLLAGPTSGRPGDTGSFSLEALIASYKAGPVSGPAAEASADLLVALSLSPAAPSLDNPSDQKAAAGAPSPPQHQIPAMWARVLQAVLQPPFARAAAGGDGNPTTTQPPGLPDPRALQHATLLLHRYAALRAKDHASSQHSQPAWTCAALDDLAVRLSSPCAPPSEGTGASEVASAPAAGLVSAALGANPAGLLLLGTDAAARVLDGLTGHLEAARPTRGAARGADVLAAAELALAVLRAPLGDGGSGLWRLLPDQACRAVTAVAQLGWRARDGVTAATYNQLRWGNAADQASSSADSSSDAEEEEEEEDEEGMLLSSASEEDEAEEGGEGGAGGDEEAAAGVVQAAAGRLWRDAQPLEAAAEALSHVQLDGLVRGLAGALASEVGATITGGEAAAAGLRPRAWAVHAAQFLRAVPGGPTGRQRALEVLMAARPEWRCWTGAGAADAGPGGSLEYLARLVETVGPAAVLGGAAYGVGNGGGDDGDADADKADSSSGATAAAAAEPGCSTSGARGGRWWVVAELLCTHHQAALLRNKEGQEHAEDEEVDEEGQGREDGCGELRSAGRRVVTRAADALLRHVVHGAVEDAEAGEAGGRDEVLRRLVDELAEGCRGEAGAAGPSSSSSPSGSDPQEPLPTTQQTAFLEALCHVFALLERTSADSHRSGPSSSSSSLPLLLAHQQHLCRHWLATARPDTAASSGLPPHALLRLLPLAASPVRRAAHAAGGAAGEAILAAAGLPDLSCAWIRHCLGRPAVLVEPSSPAVGALSVAAACFPAGVHGGGGGGIGSRAEGLAETERPLLVQLVRHQLAAFAALAALRRSETSSSPPHPEGSPAASISTSPAAATAQWPAVSEAARAAVMRLAHAAVVYVWRGLGHSDWHALLLELQDLMATAVSALSAGLLQLAAAARDTADRILQQPAGTTPAGSLALQLLRKLGQRGVLARMAQGAELEGQAEAVVGGCAVGTAAEAGAQLAAVLVELQTEVAAFSGGGSAAGTAAAAREYEDAVASCCSHVMQLGILLGGVECYGAVLGPRAAASVTTWLDRHRTFWSAVTRCAGRALVEHRSGVEAAESAVAMTAAPLEEAGLDAVGALLSVALTRGSHVMQPVAYRLLLGNALLGKVTLSGTVGGEEADAAGAELPEYEGDDEAYLTACGVRPEMARCLVSAAAAASTGAAGTDTSAAAAAAHHHPPATHVYLTAWSLLLAHMLYLDPGSRALSTVRQMLREAGHLVHGLLGLLVQELGLTAQRTGGQHIRKHAHVRSRHSGCVRGGSEAAGGEDAGAAAAGTIAGAASAKADGWRLADALRDIGLPAGPHAVRATCRNLFRAVLRALPATARGWFGDLRDRGLAVAVESYTAAAEGPALLAAEMASVQAMSHRGGGSDDDSRFTVRSSPAAREVVAVLEVEDGAVLELAVRLPACLPLKAPEVECRRKVGVNDTRLRKWLLSIATFLRHQNGSVADAIGLWKRNVDSEFAGVEACLICYSVISSVNAQLPRLVCRTCNVRFHPACLYKWFKSAGKSQCPHCQALW